jgi:tRNA(Ile)-lysidine synthase
VEREVRAAVLFGRGDLVVAAVSGGPDSMAMLHALAWLRGRLGHALVACGVDHGLRAEAGAELDLAESLARRSDVPFERVRIALEPGTNRMARARAARYAALRAVASRLGARAIAVGHQADDRAETLLMRILRGAGPAGLAVLPSRSGDLVRPMIRVRRDQVLAHLARHGVEHAIDPTNRDTRFVRSRVRLELMPVLERLDGRVVEHLCDLAEDFGALGLGAPGRGWTRAGLRQAAAAAAAPGRVGVAISLPGGRVARFDPETGAIVVQAPRGGADLATRPGPEQNVQER